MEAADVQAIECVDTNPQDGPASNACGTPNPRSAESPMRAHFVRSPAHSVARYRYRRKANFLSISIGVQPFLSAARWGRTVNGLRNRVE
jgi:hypothetical protein